MEERDYRDGLRITIDQGGEGKVLTFIDGEPEDANLSRDFSGCHGIVGMMRLAYEAGKRGEAFDVVWRTSDKWNFE